MYKTFNDLEFYTHHTGFGEQARMDFPNGYGVSVITGYMFYTRDDAPYEVAVMLHGDLCYSTPLTGDVIGYCSEDDVTRIMQQVQELPIATGDSDDDE